MSKRPPNSQESSSISKKINTLASKKCQTTKKMTIMIDEEEEKKNLIKQEMFSVPKLLQRKNQERLETAREKQLHNFQFNPALQLRNYPPVTCLLPYEPCIRLEIIQGSIPLNLITTQYIACPRGVIGSFRQPEKNESDAIFIGSGRYENFGKVVNDIEFERDKDVSLRHCMISYGHWFKQGGIRSDLLSFLVINRRRENAQTSYLPQPALSLIKEFLYDRKKLTITDVGSRLGTYVKMPQGKTFQLSKLSSFLIAPYVSFEVEEIYPQLTDFLLNYRNLGVLRSVFMTQEHEETPDVYGRFIRNAFKEYKSNIDSSNVGLVFAQMKFPCIQVRVVYFDANSGLVKSEYLIVRNSKENDNFAITFGPVLRNDIKIPAAYISFELSFRKTWQIEDVSSKVITGEELIRNAEYGLWSCLSDAKEDIRYTPKAREVVNGDEIKVGPNVFRIIC